MVPVLLETLHGLPAIVLILVTVPVNRLPRHLRLTTLEVRHVVLISLQRRIGPPVIPRVVLRILVEVPLRHLLRYLVRLLRSRRVRTPIPLTRHLEPLPPLAA